MNGFVKPRAEGKLAFTMPRRENDCCEETKKIPLEEGVSINENSDDLMNDLQ